MTGWRHNYTVWPAVAQVMKSSPDQELWDSAVFMLDKELGEMGIECHCEGCGG